MKNHVIIYIEHMNRITTTCFWQVTIYLIKGSPVSKTSDLFIYNSYTILRSIRHFIPLINIAYSFPYSFDLNTIARFHQHRADEKKKLKKAIVRRTKAVQKEENDRLDKAWRNLFI